jgi:hypothetical protein
MKSIVKSIVNQRSDLIQVSTAPFFKRNSHYFQLKLAKEGSNLTEHRSVIYQFKKKWKTVKTSPRNFAIRATPPKLSCAERSAANVHQTTIVRKLIYCVIYVCQNCEIAYKYISSTTCIMAFPAINRRLASVQIRGDNVISHHLYASP